jgi:predicted transcriptional regulator
MSNQKYLALKIEVLLRSIDTVNILQQTRLDSTDLQIISLLARDSRTAYSNLASAVGITPSAAKERINKMVSNSVIQSYIVFINPVIFGYDKLCILILKNIDKTIKEQDIFKKSKPFRRCFGHFQALRRRCYIYAIC